MKVKEITSADNPEFKTFLKLTRARGIKKHGLALLSRPKHVREVLKDFPNQCAGIILSGLKEISLEFGKEDIPIYHLSSNLFRQVDLFDTGQPILLVRVPMFTQWHEEVWAKGCSLFIPFQDPANVGAVIRSAAAFGVSRVVMLEEAAHPFLPKSVRVAGSALFRVPLFQGPSLNEFKVSAGLVVTLSPDGRAIGGYRFPETFCLVPGLEGPGLPENLRESTALAISMEPGVESINAALATGIALYLWQSRLNN
ncbi:MAG: RNA methyltransferase [Deltaproteobacteria bacterium]|nr:RNA methyltransferase [Deltaproteobacteria bacterium]